MTHRIKSRIGRKRLRIAILQRLPGFQLRADFCHPAAANQEKKDSELRTLLLGGQQVLSLVGQTVVTHFSLND